MKKLVCELECVKDEIPEVQLRREFPNLSPPSMKKKGKKHGKAESKNPQRAPGEVQGVQSGSEAL